MVIKQQEGLKHESVLRLIKDSDTLARWYYQLKKEIPALPGRRPGVCVAGEDSAVEVESLSKERGKVRGEG